MELQYRKPVIWISHTKILQLEPFLIYKVAARINVQVVSLVVLLRLAFTADA